jgi:hypothetical protein
MKTSYLLHQHQNIILTPRFLAIKSIRSYFESRIDQTHRKKTLPSGCNAPIPRAVQRVAELVFGDGSRANGNYVELRSSTSSRRQKFGKPDTPGWRQRESCRSRFWNAALLMREVAAITRNSRVFPSADACRSAKAIPCRTVWLLKSSLPELSTTMLFAQFQTLGKKGRPNPGRFKRQ